MDAERGQTGLDFELEAGGTITGVVRTGTKRSPVGLVVGVSRADGYARTQRTGAGGSYRFDKLMPGAWPDTRRVHEDLWQ